MLFAYMKRILKVDRLRLRGLSGARDEFPLTATAQNLRRMAKYLGTGPPGSSAMATARAQSSRSTDRAAPEQQKSGQTGARTATRVPGAENPVFRNEFFNTIGRKRPIHVLHSGHCD